MVSGSIWLLGLMLIWSEPAWAGGGSTYSLSIIVNFILLVAGLIYFLRKPIGLALGDRHDKVKTAVEEAEAFRAKVEGMVQEYEQKLAGLDLEVADILAEAKTRGEEERTRILARAEQMAEKIREDAERRAEKELARLEKELERDVLAQAVAKSVALLKKRVTAGDHRAFTEELLAHLEAGNGRG